MTRDPKVRVGWHGEYWVNMYRGLESGEQEYIRPERRYLIASRSSALAYVAHISIFTWSDQLTGGTRHPLRLSVHRPGYPGR